MKLIPVDLCGWNFDEFIKGIDTSKTYLAKIGDDWSTGRWSHSRNWCKGGGGWDFNFGWTHRQGNCRGDDSELDKEFLEMYEIYDEDLIVKKTIKALTEEEKKCEEDADWEDTEYSP